MPSHGGSFLDAGSAALRYLGKTVAARVDPASGAEAPGGWRLFLSTLTNANIAGGGPPLYGLLIWSEVPPSLCGAFEHLRLCAMTTGSSLRLLLPLSSR